MNTAQQINELLLKLSSNFQEAILDYTTELYELHSDPELARQKREADRATKEVLLERLIEHRLNPKRSKPMQDVLDDLNREYGFL